MPPVYEDLHPKSIKFFIVPFYFLFSRWRWCLFVEPVAAAVERETGETRSWLEVSAVAGGGLRVALKSAALALRGHPGHTHTASLCVTLLRGSAVRTSRGVKRRGPRRSGALAEVLAGGAIC